MPVPFPSATFPSGFTPYTLAAFKDPAGAYSSKSAWLVTPAPTACAFWDQTTLRARVATAISVTGTTTKTLNLTAEGTAMTFDLSGDATAMIPVAIIDP
jgi:hypothetical protein